VSLLALQDDVTKTSAKTSSSVPPMEEIEYVDISRNLAKNSVCSDMSKLYLRHIRKNKKQNMTQDQLDKLREDFFEGVD
jgi:hypothetical protein